MAFVCRTISWTFKKSTTNGKRKIWERNNILVEWSTDVLWLIINLNCFVFFLREKFYLIENSIEFLLKFTQDTPLNLFMSILFFRKKKLSPSIEKYAATKLLTLFGQLPILAKLLHWALRTRKNERNRRRVRIFWINLFTHISTRPPSHTQVLYSFTRKKRAIYAHSIHVLFMAWTT